MIVDFSKAPFGSSFYLLNQMQQTNGRGPTGQLMVPGDQMMRFDVTKPLAAPDNSRVPAQLLPLPVIDVHTARRRRTFAFDYFNGTWLINNNTFDEHRSDARVEQGSAEIWTLRNMGRGWSPPIHIHFEEFRILTRNGEPLAATDPEYGRKDVVRLGPGDEVTIFIQFRDFIGKYVMHCHNVVHEDHSMMMRWDVVPKGDGD